jgi:S1-C subfamily serine protease
VAAGFIGLGLLGGTLLVIVLSLTQGKDRNTPVAGRDGRSGAEPQVSASSRGESVPRTGGLAKQGVPEPDALAGSDRPLGGEQVYRILVRSSVLVASPTGMGTGFLVDARRGYIVTNCHVVGRESKVAVVFPMYDRAGELITDFRPYERATQDVAAQGDVIDRDQARDLALIRVERLGPNSAPVKLSARPAPTGSSVFSVGGSGAEDNLLWRLAKGTVRGRAQRRVMADVGVFDCMVLETDAPVNPGDSGGPVMNDRAELVGVVSHFHVDERQVSGNIDLEELRAFLSRFGR